MRGFPDDRARVAACIFDLDGTLVDSEPNYFASDVAFLAGYGINYDEHVAELVTGCGSAEYFRVLAERFPDSPFHSIPQAERQSIKDRDYLDYAKGRTRAFPAMRDLVIRLSERGLPLAVASGSSPEVIAFCLEEIGLAPRFEVVLSSSQVARGKPAPDVFLEAARRLGVRPSDCVVFEDAKPGIEAAGRAGMRCVALPAPGSAIEERFRRAERLIEGGPDAVDAATLLDILVEFGL